MHTKHTLKSHWTPARNLSAQERGGVWFITPLIREGGAAEFPQGWRGTSQHNLMGYKKDSCANFCGLPPSMALVESGEVNVLFGFKPCVSSQQYRQCIYSQKYTDNINNNHAFVLRTTATKESRQMGRRGRRLRKTVQVRSADCSKSVFPGCLLKSHNYLQNLCFLKMHLEKFIPHFLKSVPTD